MDSINSLPTKRIYELPQDISQKICTGLVILNLAGACRELIDNALDANSTNIEVRTVENGTELIEVIDNGSGIIPEDFDKICKPHCTSKLTGFEDFDSLNTFGFRGEALNALTNTSQVKITTRDANSRCAFRLTFDRNGEILERGQCSRQAGTTISISNLFKFLPVRRQELLRSSRRELLKLIDCVQAFAISHPNCRFNCSNVVNGKHSQLLSSPGGNIQSIDVITNLLGTPKNELIELNESNPEEDIQQIYKINTNCENTLQQIKLSGYVSNFEYGRCKIIKEKHFVYVNGRHIESQRLSKIANDLYGQYNKCGQRCILILFISIPSSSLDVNVTPDKKTLFLHFEKELFSKLHSTLISTFSKVQSQCSSIVEDLMQNKSYSLTKSQRLFYDFKSSTNLLNNLKKLERTDSGNIIQVDEEDFCQPSTNSSPLQFSKNTNNLNTNNEIINEIQTTNKTPIKDTLSITSSHSPQSSINGNLTLLSSPSSSEYSLPINSSPIIHPITSTSSNNIYRPHQTIKINFEDLRKKILKKRKREENIENKYEKINNCVASIEEADLNFDEDNEQEVKNEIERRLSLMLSKSDFKEMHLIGQFNNAFLLTRLGPNLFMIDQHAADEKYNFEILQSTTIIKSQKMFKAQVLNFGPMDFALLQDNLDLFIKNGFEFAFDEGEDERQNCLTTTNTTQNPSARLIALPNIVGHSFDKHDIDELLSMVAEMPGQLHRPRKVRSIFASKACRRSVMFGHPLSEFKMKQIIENMGKIEQPWNCPHGRPTIRHLCTVHL
ncbi:hypothetical protein ACQ4LE_005898 [Meloidogyne hapla]|uniref:DNA_mis_repair domain-containing protein n=1 Tax=Meloidogyne hapla TaxID=6305 RepID=A0A1I8C3D1_MELHA